MALGGGTFLTQNKVLPGAYINLIALSVASASLSDRGIAAMPLDLNWGVNGEVFAVTSEDFQKSSTRIFGYDYTHPILRPLRDLFRNIKLCYFYRLGSNGTPASNTYAIAKYVGTRGNDLKINIKVNVDEPAKKDVETILGDSVVDIQTVVDALELRENDFVKFKADTVLANVLGEPLSGGVNATVNGKAYQDFIEKIEGYQFNALGCPTTDKTTKQLFTSFTKRMRDEQGAKFQCVVYNEAADYEGVVNVKNDAVNQAEDNKSALVWWVTGVIAGTPVNKSALNKVYDGEYEIDVNFTQIQLENAIKDGEFTFHRVGKDICVLSDINSLVKETMEKNYLFKENQTIRVIDQIANDIAVLFNTKYLGVIPNDKDGRISLWADIVQHHEELQTIRAIENFSGDDVTVEQGNSKRSVVVNEVITVVNAMAQLYMTVSVA